MPTVPANNLFTISILHCFQEWAEPLYQENVKLGQQTKGGKLRAEIKCMPKMTIFEFNGSFLVILKRPQLNTSALKYSYGIA